MEESRKSTALKYFRENKEYMEDRIQSGIDANRKGWGYTLPSPRGWEGGEMHRPHPRRICNRISDW